jgi:UDP-N-acetylglucosamine acyltransferase
MKISPHAIIDPKAELAADVEVGPFCVIGPEVVIGPGCRLLNNVTIMGQTRIGVNNVIYPNAVIGAPPQDRKYKGGSTRVEIGEGNLFRESVTIHAGTEKGGGITRVGSNNMLMVSAHLGHDVQMGSNCTIANNTMLAGHVVVGDYVVMMGGVGVHHFVTIGDYACLFAYAKIRRDVPPYLKIDGADEVRGLNKVGLERAGFAAEDIEALEEACRKLYYRDKPFSEALDELEAVDGANRHVKRIVDFLRQRNLGRFGRYQESHRKG